MRKYIFGIFILFIGVALWAIPLQKSIDFSIQKLRWNTDTDWNKGTNEFNTEVSGTGDAAVVQAIDLANESGNIDYETPAQYTLSNSTVIVVVDGVAKLLVLAGETFTWLFTTSSSYTFNTSSVIVTGGVSRLKTIPDLVGQWHLNESAGNTADDASDNNNDGTTVNMTDGDWVAGHLNNALDFNGVDEYVNLGDIANFERTDSFSLECWFNSPANASSEILMARSGDVSGGFRGWSVFLADTGKIMFILANDEGANNRIRARSTSTGLDDGTYHHTVITYDGSSALSGVNIYIDGSSETLTDTIDNLSATTVFSTITVLAARSGGSQIFYKGEIDEVVISSIVLSSTSVAARYNSGTGTEDLRYSIGNSSITTDNGFTTGLAVETFTTTETVPSGANLKYQISVDDGVSYFYWTGSSWSVTTGGFENANVSSTVAANIETLASSGTYKFIAYFDSAGTTTPELDAVEMLTEVSFSVGDNFFVDTTTNSQFSSTNGIFYISGTFTETEQTGTDIRALLSNDNRETWFKFAGSSWVVVVDSLTRTNATELADIESNITTFPIGDKTLDLRVFIKTNISTITPSVANYSATTEGGTASSGTFTTNIFDSGELDLDWKNIEFVTTVPSNTTVSISARAANSSAEVSAASYLGPFTNNTIDGNLIGAFIQFKIEFTTTLTSNKPSVDLISVKFATPLVPTIVIP